MWVLYPVVAAVFMVFGIQYLISSGRTSISTLAVQQKEVDAEESRLAELNNKLEILKRVDSEKTKLDLAKLVSAVPQSRTVWLLIRELNEAGIRANIQLVGYKGTVGEVIEASESATVATESAVLVDDAPLSLVVEYDAPTFAELVQGLAELEKMLPLVKIAGVNYTSEGSPNAKIVIEGAWAPWTALDRDPASPLPEHENEVNRALSKIKDLEDITLVQE